MEDTLIIQKAIENCINLIQQVVKKYHLGSGNAFFERHKDKDTKQLYCFSIIFKLGGNQIVFPVGIDTFGRTFMVSGIPRIHKTKLDFKTLDENFVVTVKARGLV